MCDKNLPLIQKRVSFIGDPISGSVMYVGKKLENMLDNLAGVTGCLVFVEESMSIPPGLEQKHQFVSTINPMLSYMKYAKKIADEILEQERYMKYRLTDGGYYVGENVSIGINVLIEPGVILGHNISIGNNTTVLAGAVVKNATIGENCQIKEYALIGGQAFTMVTDEENKIQRIPCLGDIVIENCVEIGSFATICRGQNSSTRICAYTKIDDHVHVGHDVVIEEKVLIAAGSVLGGYDHIGEGVYIGLNASVKQMVTIEKGSFISMGARVTKDVSATDGVYGFPKVKVELKLANKVKSITQEAILSACRFIKTELDINAIDYYFTHYSSR